MSDWKRTAQFDLKPAKYKYTNAFTGDTRMVSRRSETSRHFIFRINSAIRKDALSRWVVLQFHSSISRNDENGRSWRGTKTAGADEETWIKAATEVLLNREDAEKTMAAIQLALIEMDRQEKEERSA